MVKIIGRCKKDQFGRGSNEVIIVKKIKGEWQKVAHLEICGGTVSRRITCEMLESIWKGN